MDPWTYYRVELDISQRPDRARGHHRPLPLTPRQLTRRRAAGRLRRIADALDGPDPA